MLDCIVGVWEAIFGNGGNGSGDYSKPNPSLSDSKVIRDYKSGQYKASKRWVVNPDGSQRLEGGVSLKYKGRVAS